MAKQKKIKTIEELEKEYEEYSKNNPTKEITKEKFEKSIKRIVKRNKK